MKAKDSGVLDIIKNIKSKKEESLEVEAASVSSQYYPSAMYRSPDSNPLYPQMIKHNQRYRGPIESRKSNAAFNQASNDLDIISESLDFLIHEYKKINEAVWQENDMQYIEELPQIAKRIACLEEQAILLKERVEAIEKH